MIAAIATAAIVAAFLWESAIGFGKRPPNLIYVESWPSARSAADAARTGRVEETQRQIKIAQFEVERGQALLLRANTPELKAAAKKHIDDAAALRTHWAAEHDAAEVDLRDHPAAAITAPIVRLPQGSESVPLHYGQP